MDKATKKFVKVNYQCTGSKKCSRGRYIETGYELVTNSETGGYSDSPSYFNYKGAADVMERMKIDGVILHCQEIDELKVKN